MLCSTHLKIQLLTKIERKPYKIKTFFAFNLSDVAFIMLINVKNANMYDRDKFELSVKRFYI